MLRTTIAIWIMLAQSLVVSACTPSINITADTVNIEAAKDQPAVQIDCGKSKDSGILTTITDLLFTIVG